MDQYRPKPDLSSKKLDFSQFHPLDHTVWECHDHPGGRRTHLKYRWEFQWRDRIRSKTYCLIGMHTRAQWHQRDLTWMGCVSCGKRLSNPQEH